MTPRDPIGFDKPSFSLPESDHRDSRAWDWPLTPAVLTVLAMTAAVVLILAVAGWLS